MDPKMDAGMLCNRANTPLTFDDAVASGHVILGPSVPPQHLLGLIDSSLACLVT